MPRTRFFSRLSEHPMTPIFDFTVTGAAAQNITLSPVNGNEDTAYFIMFYFVNAVAATNFYVRPNNDSGNNYENALLQVLNASVVGVGTDPDTGLRIGGTSADIHVLVGDAVLFAKTGQIRFMQSRAYRYGQQLFQHIDSAWDDAVTNITSLIFNASLADGFGIGSWVKVWKIRGL